MEIRSATDADWPAMAFLAATSFGGERPQEATEGWRTLVPDDGAVVACDGPDIVGMAAYLDLKLTVPGGAVLPMAGVTWVAVAPTHRRRGVLTTMFAELHARMSGYPIAGLEASEAGIYGRFGYGAATEVHHLSVDRREARFHPEVPDPGGVRIGRAVQHRRHLADVYERWRLQTPGGLYSPARLWEIALADPESTRNGGTALFCMLHADGYAMYRMHRGSAKEDGEKKYVEVTEFAALTPQAHIALWRAFLGMDLVTTVRIETHPDDVLPYLLTDPRLVRTTCIEDGLWLRLLDVPVALQARTYAADVSAVLDISGRRYSLDVTGATVRCAPTDRAADVYMDLSVLGSLYFGTHRASAFATAHRLRCNDSGLLAGLDAAFACDVPADLGFGF